MTGKIICLVQSNEIDQVVHVYIYSLQVGL